MKNTKSPFSSLTDEQILKEFVKRFECDGAILIYVENNTESGLGRWNNPRGKKWVTNTFAKIKQNGLIATPEEIDVEDALEICVL